MEFPSFHGADSFFDRHRDMRLDIDNNMSYEVKKLDLNLDITSFQEVSTLILRQKLRGSINFSYMACEKV